MKKSIIVLISLSLVFFSFISKDRTELLSRKWIMTEMEIEGMHYSEEMIERQKSKGLVTILQFTKGGTCYVNIFSPKSRVTKRNQWQFMSEENQLAIQAEGEKDTRIFDIVKLSAKKMILSIEDNNAVQVFHYEAYKKK